MPGFRPIPHPSLIRTAKLVALLCTVVAPSHAVAETSTTSLQIIAARPALLWLEAEDAVADNVTEPANNNLPLTVEVVSDGSLSVTVRSNYDYWLTVSGPDGVSHISGGSTGLEWVSLSDELLPKTAEGDVVRLMLEWQADCTHTPESLCRSGRAKPVSENVPTAEKRPDLPVR